MRPAHNRVKERFKSASGDQLRVGIMSKEFLEILEEVGIDNIKYQNLDHCISSMKARTDHNEFTFLSDQPFGPEGPDEVGIVLWIPRGEYQDIVSRWNGEESK